MKKMFVLVLLVPVLTIAFISCDADMRSNLAGFMGGLGGNVYIDNGWAKPNTADAEAAVATIASFGTGSGAVTVSEGDSSSELGIPITVPAGVTKVLAPQTSTQQTELKNDIATALASPTQTKTLITQLQTQITDTEQREAAAGTVEVFNLTIAALANALPPASDLADTISALKLETIGAGDTITQGDMLILQMMTNLVSNTVASLNEVSSNNLGSLDESTLSSAANKDKVLSIVDDALFTAQIAEQLSGAASIDFSGQLDLVSLLNNLNKSTSRTSKSGTPIDIGEASEFLPTINGIVPDILELMGVTKSGDTFSYTEAKYKSFIQNQKAYRAAIEHGMTFKRKGGIAQSDLNNANLDASTLIKYALAVFITEHEAYVKTKATSSDTGNSLILAFLDENPNLANGTLTSESQLNRPDSIDTYYDAWPDFLKDGYIGAIPEGKTATRNIAYYKTIVNTLLEINKSGGIAQLTTELEKFLVDSENDSLDDWYNGL